MIFVRYMGPDIGTGEFTKGRTYVGKPLSLSDGDSFLHVYDDVRTMHNIDMDDARFTMHDEIYGIVVDKVAGDIGSVVQLNDTATDWFGYHTKGGSVHKTDAFVILDLSNVCPGMWVIDLTDGLVKRISIIDDTMWLRLDGATGTVSPVRVRFFIADKDLLFDPMVKCVDDVGRPELTDGDRYRLHGSFGDIVTVSVNGEVREYDEARFKII